jgi:hypothetical protein
MCLNEICTGSEVRVSKYLPDGFCNHHGMKQRDASSLLFLNFASEYAITKVKIEEQGLELNGLYQLLACPEYFNLLGKY